MDKDRKGILARKNRAAASEKDKVGCLQRRRRIS